MEPLTPEEVEQILKRNLLDTLDRITRAYEAGHTSKKILPMPCQGLEDHYVCLDRVVDKILAKFIERAGERLPGGELVRPPFENEDHVWGSLYYYTWSYFNPKNRSNAVASYCTIDIFVQVKDDDDVLVKLTHFDDQMKIVTIQHIYSIIDNNTTDGNAFHLFYIEGKKYKAIAKECNCSEDDVKSAIRREQVRIKDRIEEVKHGKLGLLGAGRPVGGHAIDGGAAGPTPLGDP